MYSLQILNKNTQIRDLHLIIGSDICMINLTMPAVLIS